MYVFFFSIQSITCFSCPFFVSSSKLPPFPSCISPPLRFPNGSDFISSFPVHQRPVAVAPPVGQKRDIIYLLSSQPRASVCNPCRLPCYQLRLSNIPRFISDVNAEVWHIVGRSRTEIGENEAKAQLSGQECLKECVSFRLRLPPQCGSLTFQI